MENNLADKISELLSDPEGMARIEAMAQSILGDEQKKSEQEPDLSGINIAGMLSALKNSGEDDRSRLLLALRPHLSPERRERVDKAVKLLRIVSIMPLLKESGLLNDIL
ncbi:MAG: hypothetical protein IKL44_05300 [Clostridia bacterium]|nr:hypothetical protein [Clostridia bacterium]MBR3594075.1 hypothetical protein [Clostridia bacterium]